MLSNKSEGCIIVLLEADCQEVVNQTWLQYLLQQADEYFYTTDGPKYELLKQLDRKYHLDEYTRFIPHMLRQRLTGSIAHAVQGTDLMEVLLIHKQQLLQSVHYPEVMSLLINAFNKDIGWHKSSLRGFGPYVQLVNEVLQGRAPEFWHHFFEKNIEFDAGSEFRKPSLAYLKKKFISWVYQKYIGNRYELISRLDYQYKATLLWIWEDIREHALIPGSLYDFEMRFSSFLDKLKK